MDAISPAFQHAKQQLLEPFRVSQWAKLALVGFLAGELSSGGCNFHYPGRSHIGDMTGLPGGINPLTYAGLIAVLIVAGFLIGILFLYVNSVMRFVLFDSVVNRRCEIRRSWSARHSAGLRYFVWQVFVLLAMIVGIIIVVGIPIAFAIAMGWIREPKAHVLPLVLGGFAMFFAILALMLLYAAIHVMTKDFVVPQMALEDITALEAWRRLLAQVATEKASYAGYLGMKIAMALGAAIAVGIVSAVVILALLIPFGSVGLAAILGGKAAGLTWNLYTISVAVIAGCIALFFLLYVLSLVSVPVIVFFPAYALYFFADRYPRLRAVLLPVGGLPTPGTTLPYSPGPLV